MKPRFLFLVLLIIFLSSTFLMAESKNEKANILYHQALIESNLYKKEQLLYQAYTLYPKDGKIAYLYGRTLYKRKKEEKGYKVLNLASKNPTFKFRVYKYMGEFYFYKKKLRKANRYFQQLIDSKGEDNYLNNYRLGEINCHRGLRRYSDSNKYFLKAYKLRRFKKNKDILLYIAENYYHLDDYKNSISYLSIYPYANKNNKEAFKLLIKSHNKAQNIGALKKNLKKYLKVWPKDRWAVHLLKQMMDKTEDPILD